MDGEADDPLLQDGGRREQAKAERRTRIVRAARDLIRETGDTDLSMRAIASRAGVSLTTPYNLFGSKRAVVLAVFEDEQDFAARFSRLQAANALDRIFAAHELANSYFVEDPEFYRTLWKALLNTQGADSTGLATPERLEANSAAWRILLQGAEDENLLERIVSPDLLERTLSNFVGGTLLAWAMGLLSTEALGATTSLGYALILRGAATPAGAAILQARIDACRQALAGG